MEEFEVNGLSMATYASTAPPSRQPVWVEVAPGRWTLIA